jgi:chromosome segregation ATPase
MRIQSETFLNGLKGVQNDSVLREISDLQGNVRQIHKHNEDTHERLSRIHDAVQEKQKGSPAINQEVGQLLEMDGKMHQAGLKSDYLDPMLRDIAALRSTVQEIQKHHVDTNDRLSRIHDAFHEKQKESPAINKDVSQLLEQMGSTLQQPVLSDASLDPVLAEIAELQSNVQTIHKHHEEKLLPAIQKHHDDNLAQLLPNIQRLQRATETLPELKNSLIRIQDDVAAISKKLQQEFGSGTADRVFVDLGVSTPNVNQDEKGRDQFRDLGLPMASQSQDEKVPVDLRSENAFEASSDRRDSGSDRRRSLGSLEAW